MDFKTGDIIKTTCHIPMCFHLAVIYVIDDKVYVFNNAPSKSNVFGGNIVFQPIEEFLSDRRLIETYSSPLTERDILNYTNTNKKRKWDDINYNCETYVNEMMGKDKTTTQLGKGLLALAVLCAAIYITEK
jgi:hypothetical protein